MQVFPLGLVGEEKGISYIIVRDYRLNTLTVLFHAQEPCLCPVASFSERIEDLISLTIYL